MHSRVAADVLVPREVFRGVMKTELAKIVTQPTSSTACKGLRRTMPFTSSRETIQEVFSTSNGMPSATKPRTVSA